MILLNERSNATYESSSLQLEKLDSGAIYKWNYYKNRIPEQVLYREFPLINGQEDPREGKGYEDSPHITILYGLPATVASEEVQQVVLANLGDRTSFTIEDIDYFSSPDKPYDVAILRCSSEFLSNLHFKVLEHFGVKSDFPGYTPHITLAYIQKGWRAPQSRFVPKPYISFDGEINLSYPDRQKPVLYTLEGFHG